MLNFRNCSLIILSVMAFCVPSSLFAQKMTPDTTVCFVQRDSISLYMDIYNPDPSKVISGEGKERPTIIHIFGGGFKEGSREETWLRPWFRQMNSLGYRMITIDYRLGLKDVKGVTQSKFAELLDKAIDLAVEDLFSATAYLVENGAALGIAPHNIVVTGSSAGAITAQQAEYELCARTPMTSVLPKDFNYVGIMAFAGAVLTDGELSYESKPCPVMMFHGTEDELVPYEIAQTGKVRFNSPCTCRYGNSGRDVFSCAGWSPM